MLNVVTYGWLVDKLRANLDDEISTGFTDNQILQLINDAQEWVIAEMYTHDYFYVTFNVDVTVTSGTSVYPILPTPDNVPVDIRHIIMVERTDGDRRQQGTVIDFRNRNRLNGGMNHPIVYFKHQQDTDGQFKKHMVFAAKDQPTENQTISIEYATNPVPFTGDVEEGSDYIPPQFTTLLLLRATVQGYGGERNVDQFWLNQYQSAWDQATMLMEDGENSMDAPVMQVTDDNFG